MKNKNLAYAIWPWGTDTEDQFITAIKEIKEAGFNCFESVSSTIDMHPTHQSLMRWTDWVLTALLRRLIR